MLLSLKSTIQFLAYDFFTNVAVIPEDSSASVRTILYLTEISRVISSVKNIWNWNILTDKKFISYTKWESFHR